MRWLLVLCLLTGPAWAQDDDVAIVAEARRHFQRGSALYKLGDHAQALAEFRAAYSISQAPGLLFNMGQAARGIQDWHLAAYYFRTYLRLVPSAPERAYIEGQLAQLEPVLSASPPPAPAPEPEPSPPPAAPRVDTGGRGLGALRVAGIATAGGGVALGATAVWLGLRARDASDDVSRAFRDSATYDPELAERYRVGRRDEKLAIAAGITGGALVVGGVVMWILGGKDNHGDVAVVPQPGGLAVGYSCAF